MAATKRKKGNTGKRYTDKQKQRILNFVSSRGRGGISAATKKFGVSYIALARWMKGVGKGTRRLGRPPKAKADKRSKKTVKTALIALKGLKKQFTILQRTLKKLR